MSKFRPFFFALIPFVLLGLFVWSQVPEEPTPRQAAARATERRAQPVPAPAHDLGVELPPVQYIRGQPTAESLSWRVAALVASNPDQQFRTEMDEAVLSGKLAINWTARPGSMASFTVVEPLDDENVTLMSQGYQVNRFQPIIMIDPQQIINLNSRTAVVQMQLVLQHEFEHYKDWLRASSREKFFYLYRLSRLSPQEFEAVTGITRHEHCLQMLNTEVQAYTVECSSVLAHQEQEHVFDLCKGVDEPGYREFIKRQLQLNYPVVWGACPDVD